MVEIAFVVRLVVTNICPTILNVVCVVAFLLMVYARSYHCHRDWLDKMRLGVVSLENHHPYYYFTNLCHQNRVNANIRYRFEIFLSPKIDFQFNVTT